jgi:IS30 family transposase
MAFQRGMDKTLSIKQLHSSGMSKRGISRDQGISRNAVRRHLSGIEANDTKAPTGSEGSNDAKSPTGSEEAEKGITIELSRSSCERFRDVILSKLEQGLDAQRIYHDLIEEYSFEGKYGSVRRFVKRLGTSQELPFRRIDVDPRKRRRGHSTFVEASFSFRRRVCCNTLVQSVL